MCVEYGRTRALVAATLLALALACGRPADPDEVPTEAPTEPAAPARVDRAALVAAADARALASSSAFSSAQAELRAEAHRGLALRQDPGDLPQLAKGLRDPTPEVRSWAGLGVASLPVETPRVGDLLVGAMVSEEDPELRGALARDLGRVAKLRHLPTLLAGLEDTEPSARAGAALGLGELGLRQREIGVAARASLGGLLDPEEPSSVRRAAAWALSRLPPPEATGASRGVTVALGRAVGDSDPEVRAHAYRALARQPEAELAPFRAGLSDPDLTVAAQAIAGLAALAAVRDGGAAEVAAMLRQLAEPWRGGETPPAPARARLPLAIAAAQPLARAGPIFEVASELYRRLERAPGRPDAARARAHCDLAGLVDAGRGWPTQLSRCGFDQIPEDDQQVRVAALLGRLDGADAQRLARLRRMTERAPARVHAAALRALSALGGPEAIELATTALADPDLGVRISGLEALHALALREAPAEEAPPPFPTLRVVEALEAMWPRLVDEQTLEGLVRWAELAMALESPALAESLRALALHPSHGVRAAAVAALEATGAEVPAGPPRESPFPFDPALTLPAHDRPRVALETTAGRLVIELRPDVAPVTVARFLERVDAGVYDGLTFHRVEPGFVIQGGDPRGDGYGGGERWQRCETSRLPFRRGTVGVALAGRDTGGAQFFIALGAHPHLEGRYPAFAEVVEGLERLDDIEPGERIERAHRPGG